MFPLQVITVGPAGASSVSFTNIPNTYTHLQIRAITRDTDAGGFGLTTTMNFNSDTGANYSWHWLYGNGSSAAANSGSSATTTALGWTTGTGGTANSFAGIVIDILDYANTNKNKTSRVLYGIDLNGSGGVWLSSGSWRSTSAITSITFNQVANFTQYSQFALYGVKSA
jgi:hypothetical protein